jgi:hypothetical protein
LDTLNGGPGQDTINARDFGPDTVDCGTDMGPVNDSATLDPMDTDVNCETRTIRQLDEDGDGVNGDTDCNDADPKIKPGATDVPDNGIDEDCSGADTKTPPPPPVDSATTPPVTNTAPPLATTPQLGAAVIAKWLAKTRNTAVKKLTVTGAPVGAVIRISCKSKKKGCPFKTKVLKTKSAAPTALASLFKKRKLRPGTVLEIRITAPGFIGRLFRFTIRKSKPPLKVSLPLAA